MSEFSACFWGWLANLEKCQADKRQHTGRRRRCCLLGPGPQTTTLTTTTNKQMPRQAKSRKTINENKQREMRSEKNKCKYTGKESAIGNCDCVDCDHLLLPVLALLDCVAVAVWLRVLSLFIYAPKRFIFIFIWPRESTLLLAERDLKTGLLAPVSGYKIVSCDFYLCRRRQRMLSNR